MMKKLLCIILAGFGYALYSFGDDLMLQQVTVLTNPVGEAGASFGHSIACNDSYVVVGAPEGGSGEAGVVYWFNTNGTLLHIVTNPAPAREIKDDRFGDTLTVSPLGKLAVGTPGQSVNGKNGAGCVYLYDTDGSLIKQVVCPEDSFFAPAFGTSLSSCGVDGFVVGAPGFGGSGLPLSAGQAYRFDWQGNHVATFVNASPETWDYFGSAVAAGSGYVAVGSPKNTLAPDNRGEVSVYSVDGSFIRSVTNTSVWGAGSEFGGALAMYDDGRILVGAAGAMSNINAAGAVYIVDTGGNQSDGIMNPDAASFDAFGAAVAVWNGNIAVGAPGCDTFYVYNENSLMITTPINHMNDELGSALSCSGDYCWVGAEGGACVYGYVLCELAPPDESVSAYEAVTDTRKIYLKWSTKSSGVLVCIAEEGTQMSELPAEGMRYAEGDLLGNSRIVYCGKATSSTVMNLNPGQDYTLYFYPYNDSATNIMYHTDDVLTGTVRTIDMIREQSFEAGYDTWDYTADPDPYYAADDFDVWHTVSNIVADEGKTISQALHGSMFFGMSDLGNDNGGGDMYHTLRFDPVDIRGFTNIQLRFWYYTDGYDYEPPDDLDDIRVSVMYDQGTIWTNYVDLWDNSDCWFPYLLNVPDTAEWIRVSFEVRQNGNKEPGGWDSIQLSGYPVAVETTTRGVPYTWLQQYGINDDYEQVQNIDTDDDGMCMWQEYIAGTEPYDAGSCFKCGFTNGTACWWPVVTGRKYSVWSKTNMMAPFERIYTGNYPASGYTVGDYAPSVMLRVQVEKTDH